MLLHKGVKIRLLAFLALAQHFIEITDHLAHFGDVFGGHVLQRLLHTLEELLHHLLLQTLQQFLELLTRLIIHEVVFREPLDLAGNILWQLLKILLLAPGDHLQHLLLLLGSEIVIASRGLPFLTLLSTLTCRRLLLSLLTLLVWLALLSLLILLTCLGLLSARLLLLLIG